MENAQLIRAPVAKAEMLIRRPVEVVYEAFVDPAVTTKFWFTKSSGRLEPGQEIRWDWEMYGASVDLRVIALEQNRRILIEWSSDAPTTVEWIFTPRPDDTTFVSMQNAGFHGDADQVVGEAIDATEAFTLVLAGAKAFLEHGLTLNLVADRFPDGLA